MNTAPATLIEAITYFADPDRCLDFIVALRWPNGVVCPTCGSPETSFLSTRRVWKCKNSHPKQQFSVKVGTISRTALSGWTSGWLPCG